MNPFLKMGINATLAYLIFGYSPWFLICLVLGCYWSTQELGLPLILVYSILPICWIFGFISMMITFTLR